MTTGVEVNGSPVRIYDARQQAEQRALADTIPADHTQRFAAIDFQGNVFKRPVWRLPMKPDPPPVGDTDIPEAHQAFAMLFCSHQARSILVNCRS
jgi:hypothetical protein